MRSSSSWTRLASIAWVVPVFLVALAGCSSPSTPATHFCDTQDCSGRGTCIESPDAAVCVCNTGFGGADCSTCYAGYHDDGTGACVLDQQCMVNTCDTHGTCAAASGVVACTCDAGYTGTSCDACASGFHRTTAGTCVADESCATNPCVNGTCSATGGVVTCDCPTGFGGATCATCAAGFHSDGAGGCVLDASCQVNSCSTHGTCTAGTSSVSCACDTGYAGTSCQNCASGFHRDAAGACVADESCTANDPCVNGTCGDAGGVVTCSCDPGYAGAVCNTCAPGFHDDGSGTCMLDQQCMPTSCGSAQAGTCAANGGVVSCTCNTGYTGTYCASCATGYHLDASGSCVADQTCAANDPCVHGTCDDTGGIVSCACAAGYAGSNCDGCAAGFHDDGSGACVLDQQCTTTTCSGSLAGACSVTGGVAGCACNTGYTGTYCDTCATGYHRDATFACVADESCAVTNPCVNGVCLDAGGVVSCACNTGYTGFACNGCAPGFHDDGSGACVLDQQCMATTCSGSLAGTCSVSGGVVSCACATGYTGAHCDSCNVGFHRDATGACVVDQSCAAGDPCVGGTCFDTGGVITCACATGYAGALCDRCAAGFHDGGAAGCVLDEQCMATTCSGALAGACSVTAGVVSCSCNTGYAGTYCDACDTGFHRDATGACAANDSCATNDPCVHGICATPGGVYACSCDTGYAGALCDTCAAGFHDDGTGACVLDQSCLPGMCSPNGTCDDSTGTAVCTCDTGYFTCDYECRAIGANATDAAFDQPNSTGGFGGQYFGQSFTAQVTGDLTQIDVGGISAGGPGSVTLNIYRGDVCGSSPCGPLIYSAVVPLSVGWNAYVLPAPIPVTAGSRFTWQLQSGSAINASLNTTNGYAGGRSLAVGSYDMSFSTKITRKACGESCAASNPCKNGGTCSDANGIVACACPAGYAGVFCADCAPGFHASSGACVPNEICLPGMCSPNGSCDDSTGVVKCNCSAGFYQCRYECDAYSPSAVDVSFTATNTSVGGILRQTWTATATGLLTQIAFPGMTTNSGTSVLTIYPGACIFNSGTCAAPIGSSTVTYAGPATNAMLAVPIPVTSGQMYTWVLEAGGSSTLNNSNAYPGGDFAATYGISWGWDLPFITYVSPTVCAP